MMKLLDCFRVTVLYYEIVNDLISIASYVRVVQTIRGSNLRVILHSHLRTDMRNVTLSLS
jgi:hypothetical protein